ncbi:MAG: FAD-dependent oxidoreductase [Candidatus Hodarchaeales archaeon]|jgi:heterodisulfide reductase subunit A
MKKAVFLCNCENTLDEYLDFQQLEELASNLKGVVHTEKHTALCTRMGFKAIQSAVKSNEVDGVIIGACSPRKHEDLFERALEEIKNGEVLLEQAAIREHAAWIHRDDHQLATKVAEVLVDLGDASLSLAEPTKLITIDLEKKVLVIGGGVAGMQSALDLAGSGVPVVLVEKEKELGGRAGKLAKTYPTMSCGICCIESCVDCVLTPKQSDILTHPLITTYLESEVTDFSGRFGNFLVTIMNKEGEEVTETVGIVFVATGSDVFDPSSIPHYNYSHPDVITSMELNEMMIAQRGQDNLTRSSDGTVPKAINFVLCVGSRAHNPLLGSTHCSIVCCSFAVGTAKTIRQMHPETEVYIHYIDMRAPYRGFEDLYREARQAGVTFVRGRVAEIREMPGTGLQVLTKDMELGRTVQINSDLVVLYVGQEPPTGTEDLSKMLHKSLDTDGYFKELNLRLEGPIRIHTRTREPGVFIVGCAQGPRGIRQSVADARAAVMTTLHLLTDEKVSIGRIKADVDKKRCDGCAYCVEPCPFDAITLLETDTGKLVLIDETYCEGCGICQATCPKEGVHVKNFTQSQIRAKVNRALEYSSPNPKILAFLCNWCGFPAADLAGVNKAKHPPIIPIRVMCSGMVHPNILMDAFTRGVDGILVFGCLMGDCHYDDGNKMMDQRRKTIELMMDDLGLEPERLRVEWVSGAKWKKYTRVITEFHDNIENLGPSPFI